jgi:hypothetical protein
MVTPNPRMPFWLQFQVYSDGLTHEHHPAHNTSFSQFPYLPPELRLKIWELLLVPRIVVVCCLHADTAPEDQLEGPSCPFIPALLHVNRETRHLALKHYEPTFAWKVPYQLSSACCSDGHQKLMEWSEPTIYFDFEHDALFLRGELELYDQYGFNSPMTYFLRKEDTMRVRRVALAFRALRYGETGGQQIFGALFHVVDRFAPADGKVLVVVDERDEWTHSLMGGEHPLVEGGGGGGGGGVGIGDRRQGMEDLGTLRQAPRENVVQKTWREWYRGSTIRSKLVNMEFELINEMDLEGRVAQST